MNGGQAWIERDARPPRWWQFTARENRRRYPMPDPLPGELYVQYLGDRDAQGNVHYLLYWYEPWARIDDRRASVGDLRAQRFFCDDRLSFRLWLLQYDRIIDWPSGDDIAAFIRERTL